MGLFYTSKTYQLISQGISDLHCYSDGYLVDELMLEYHLKKDIGYYKDEIVRYNTNRSYIQ